MAFSEAATPRPWIAAWPRGNFLAQTALDPMGHRVNHVIVDLIGDLLRKMRSSIRHPFAWERRRVLDAEKHRAHGSCENQSFHLKSLLYKLDRIRTARIRVHSQKIRSGRLLTLTLSSNEEERELALNFVCD